LRNYAEFRVIGFATHDRFVLAAFQDAFDRLAGPQRGVPIAAALVQRIVQAVLEHVDGVGFSAFECSFPRTCAAALGARGGFIQCGGACHAPRTSWSGAWCCSRPLPGHTDQLPSLLLDDAVAADKPTPGPTRGPLPARPQDPQSTFKPTPPLVAVPLSPGRRPTYNNRPIRI
jgi:hypothetical protein